MLLRWIAPLALTLAPPALAQTAPKQTSLSPEEQKHAVVTIQDALARLQAVPADPALWVVKDKDTTIYLFGTIHVLKPNLSWFDAAVRKAFDASGTLVLELVMPPPAEMQALVAKTGLSSDPTPLSVKLPAKERAAYLGALATLGMPASTLDRFKPWLAANYLTLQSVQKLGYDAGNGPETVLAAAAAKTGKPVQGLETAAQQLGYFDALSPDAQLAMLTSTIDELPTLPKTIDEMTDDWAKGTPEKLATLMNDDLDDSPELKRVLLHDRNARWADWIATRMKAPGIVFIAVGAGHLAGADSVQAMLAARHLTATRVRY